MAGITFELKKLYSEENIGFGNLKATIYSGFVVVGPWILSIVTLRILAFLSEIYFDTEQELNYFMTTLNYAFIVSQILAAPWQYFITRYISDSIYKKRYGDIRASFIGIMKISLVTSYVVGMILMKNSSLPSFYNKACVALIMILSSLWVVTIYVGVLKKYTYVFKTYFLGILLTIVSSYLFYKYVPLREFISFPPYILLSSYVLGMSLVFFMLTSHISAFLEGKKANEYGFLDYIIRYKTLITIGILMTLGSWGHLIMQWYFGDFYIIGNIYRISPYYSTALFYAYLLTIPIIIYFNIFMETDFYVLYKIYYSKINNNKPLSEVNKAKQNMIMSFKNEMVYIFRLESLIILIALFASERIFIYLGISLSFLSFFKILLIGAMMSINVTIYVIILLYFDLRKEAARSSLFFFATTIVFEGIALLVGKDFSGFGFLVATLVSSAYIEEKIFRTLRHLNFETFYKQNFKETKNSKLVLFMKNGMKVRAYLLIVLAVQLLISL